MSLLNHRTWGWWRCRCQWLLFLIHPIFCLWLKPSPNLFKYLGFGTCVNLEPHKVAHFLGGSYRWHFPTKYGWRIVEDNRCNWKEGILFLQKSPCWWKMGPVSKEYSFHLTKWIFFIAEYTRIFNLYIRTQHSKGCPPYSLGDISSFLVNVQPKTKPSSFGMMNKSWHQQIYIHTILQKSAPIAIGVDFPLSKRAPPRSFKVTFEERSLHHPKKFTHQQLSKPLWHSITLIGSYGILIMAYWVVYSLYNWVVSSPIFYF